MNINELKQLKKAVRDVDWGDDFKTILFDGLTSKVNHTAKIDGFVMRINYHKGLVEYVRIDGTITNHVLNGRVTSNDPVVKPIIWTNVQFDTVDDICKTIINATKSIITVINNE